MIVYTLLAVAAFCISFGVFTLGYRHRHEIGFDEFKAGHDEGVRTVMDDHMPDELRRAHKKGVVDGYNIVLPLLIEAGMAWRAIELFEGMKRGETTEGRN